MSGLKRGGTSLALSDIRYPHKSKSYVQNYLQPRSDMPQIRLTATNAVSEGVPSRG